MHNKYVVLRTHNGCCKRQPIAAGLFKHRATAKAAVKRLEYDRMLKHKFNPLRHVITDTVVLLRIMDNPKVLGWYDDYTDSEMTPDHV